MPRTRKGPADFGPRLRQLRLDAGLSLDALSALSGLSKSHLFKLEQAGSDPGLATLRALIRALGFDVALAAYGPPPSVTTSGFQVGTAYAAAFCAAAFQVAHEVALTQVHAYFGTTGSFNGQNPPGL